MGCTASPEDREAQRKSKDIESQIRKDNDTSNLVVKLLLLGAGESGKSTIAKQMRIIHNKGHSPEQLESFRIVIYENILRFLNTLVYTSKMENKTLEPDIQECASKLSEFVDQNHFADIPPETWECCRTLWKSESLKSLTREAEKYHLNISLKALVDDMDTISQIDYIPSEQHVLLARVKTTGITEERFMFRDILFLLYDVGGQRSERRKWIHCFENVKSLIFCVAISEYDQFLEEDSTTNRMRESLKLFDSIINNSWFEHIPIILFLNKTDLFEAKIQGTPLSVCFPEYTGPNTKEEAQNFIKKQFEALNRGKGTRQIYTHFTCATDTQQINFLFNGVTDIIMKNALSDYGLY